jgi:hypothetical protein
VGSPVASFTGGLVGDSSPFSVLPQVCSFYNSFLQSQNCSMISEHKSIPMFEITFFNNEKKKDSCSTFPGIQISTSKDCYGATF